MEILAFHLMFLVLRRCRNSCANRRCGRGKGEWHLPIGTGLRKINKSKHAAYIDGPIILKSLSGRFAV